MLIHSQSETNRHREDIKCLEEEKWKLADKEKMNKIRIRRDFNKEEQAKIKILVRETKAKNSQRTKEKTWFFFFVFTAFTHVHIGIFGVKAWGLRQDAFLMSHSGTGIQSASFPPFFFTV